MNNVWKWAVNGVWCYRERIGECVFLFCMVQNWTVERKFKVGDPHMYLLILLHKFKYSIMHGCGTYSARYYVKLSYYLVFFTKRVIYLETYFDANYCSIHTRTPT